MISYQHETRRLVLRGRGKELLLESFGSACGLPDGVLCEDSTTDRHGLEFEDYLQDEEDDAPVQTLAH